MTDPSVNYVIWKTSEKHFNDVFRVFKYSLCLQDPAKSNLTLSVYASSFILCWDFTNQSDW